MKMTDLRILEDLEQGSPEWHNQRRGMITASVVGQLISVGAPDALTVDCPKCSAAADASCLNTARKMPTPIKNVHSERSAKASTLPPTYSIATGDTARGLIATLAAERITGETEESFMNRDMERGVLYESVIRDRYAEVRNIKVQQVGFAVRTFPGGARLGASPDGLVGDDGGIEIKAPRAKGHVITVVADEVPANYMAQVQASLLVTGREWWDYVQAAAGRLYVKRVLPDPAWHAAITAAVIAAERAIEQQTSDYLTAAESLPTIAPYVNPYDMEVSI
jgi:hypothetical protein